MTNAEDIQRKRDSMDQTMPFAELYERSKDDRAIIVGSEVREVIGAYRRCLQRLDREPAAPALPAVEQRGETPLTYCPHCGRKLSTDNGVILPCYPCSLKPDDKEAQPAVHKHPTQRQIVFNWMMGEIDLSTHDGWWGTSQEVERIDLLLHALNPPDDKDAIIGQLQIDALSELLGQKLGANYRGVELIKALTAEMAQQAETIRQLTELLRGYRYSTKNSHSYNCTPARFYPGLGFMDDRCPLCIKADLLLKENK